MSFREDLNKPLDKIENVFLRRGITVIMTICLVIPIELLFHIVDALFKVYEETKEFFISCWIGPNK